MKVTTAIIRNSADNLEASVAMQPDTDAFIFQPTLKFASLV